MDWYGQSRAEQFYQLIISLTTVIALAIAYLQQDLKIAYAGTVVGFVISCIAVVPDWPYLNRHGITWHTGSSLTASTAKTVLQTTDATIDSDATSASSKRKNKKQK